MADNIGCKAYADLHEDPWKSPRRCVLALDFRYPDFFSEFYPDYDIYLKKKKKKKFFFWHFSSKIRPTRLPALHYNTHFIIIFTKF